jgi:hypothetical protein
MLPNESYVNVWLLAALGVVTCAAASRLSGSYAKVHVPMALMLPEASYWYALVLHE